MNKEQVISSIKQRILDEQMKHKTLDWPEIAARKIYSTHLVKEKCNLPVVKPSPTRKGTGLYMITMTALCGLLGGVGWYHLGIEVGIFTILLLVIMISASIRYNQ